MKLRLICSGLSHLPRMVEEGNTGGCRLPRVMLARDSQQFLPDFALLLLVDEVLMDRATFEGLLRGQIQSGPTVPLLARLLHQEGFLRLVNLEAAARAQESRLAALVQTDLQSLGSWIPTVRAWFLAWQTHYQGIQVTLRPTIKQLRDAVAAGRPAELDYSQQASKFIHDTGGRYQMASFYAEDALATEAGQMDDERGAEFSTLLSEELRYARGNLDACRDFGAALHDWCDLEPFYKEILARTGQPVEPGIPRPGPWQLLDLALPEFSFWLPENVLRALKDPRVRQLREKVRASLGAGQPLDPAVARKALGAVRRFDHSIATVRMVSAVALPAPSSPKKKKGAASGGGTALADSVLLLTSRSLDAQLPKNP